MAHFLLIYKCERGSEMKYQIVLASHGSLAEGMASAVKMISGEHANLHSFGLDMWKTPQAIDEQVEKIVQNHGNERLIILCDIKGGSVHNKLIDRCLKNDAIVISGMNLGLVLDIVLKDDSCICEDSLKNSIEQAAKSISYFDHNSFKKEAEGDDSLW